MARREWTSVTLPKIPEIEDPDQRADLWFARWEAHADLLHAEAAERDAIRLRQMANASVQHYKDLLEALHGTLFDE